MRKAEQTSLKAHQNPNDWSNLHVKPQISVCMLCVNHLKDNAEELKKVREICYFICATLINLGNKTLTAV